MKWHEYPVAMIGSISLAYHQVLRGRRVSVCQWCGRLNHASADLCLCGGDTEPATPVSEVLDDASTAKRDALAPLWAQFAVFAVQVAVLSVVILWAMRATEAGDAPGVILALLGAAVWGRFT